MKLNLGIKIVFKTFHLCIEWGSPIPLPKTLFTSWKKKETNNLSHVKVQIIYHLKKLKILNTLRKIHKYNNGFYVRDVKVICYNIHSCLQMVLMSWKKLGKREIHLTSDNFIVFCEVHLEDALHSPSIKTERHESDAFISNSFLSWPLASNNDNLSASAILNSSSFITWRDT